MNRFTTHPTPADRHPDVASERQCARILLLLAALLPCLTAATEAHAAGKTTRVSVDSAGNQSDPGGKFGRGASNLPALSADGRYVAFESDADNLVPGDTNGVSDVFVHDRNTRRTTRVSVDSAGIQGDAYSDMPALSADGRYVAFMSFATNLVRGGIYPAAIFVHDRKRHRTSRVSVDSEGVPGDNDSARPVISTDGRYVAFASRASNLVPGDTNGTWDIFVHDRITRQTTRVSVDSTGAQTRGDQATFPPSTAMSADGRFVLFSSDAPDLVPGDTNRQTDVFLHDRTTHQTTRVSVNSDGDQMDGNIFDGDHVTLSADGRVAAFSSDAANLVPHDTNHVSDVFVHDRLFDASATADLGLVATRATDAGSSPNRRTFKFVAGNHGPSTPPTRP